MRRLVVALVVTGTALVAAPAVMSAPGAHNASRWKLWVSDLQLSGYPPQTVLHVKGRTASGGAPPVFLFVDRQSRGTRWKVCVNRSDGRVPCASGRTGTPGRPSGRSLFPLPPGSYTARFTANGTAVGSINFRVVP